MFNGRRSSENGGRPHYSASQRRKLQREDRRSPRVADEELNNFERPPIAMDRTRPRPGHVSFTKAASQKGQAAKANNEKRKWFSCSFPRPSFANILFLILISQLLSICFFGLNLDGSYGIRGSEEGGYLPMLEKTRRLLGSLGNFLKYVSRELSNGCNLNLEGGKCVE